MGNSTTKAVCQNCGQILNGWAMECSDLIACPYCGWSIHIVNDTYKQVGAPVITVEPTAEIEVAKDMVEPTPVTLTATGNGTLEYQWYSASTPSKAGATPIAGADSNSYTPPVTSAGVTYYYCEVKNIGYGKEQSVDSEFCEYTVTNVVAPTIATDVPETTVEYNFGDTTSATDLGLGVSPFGIQVLEADQNYCSYQWYYNDSESTEGATLIEGSTGSQCPIISTYEGTPPLERYYYCVVTKTQLGITLTAQSDYAFVRVTGFCRPPVINTDLPATESVVKDVTGTLLTVGAVKVDAATLSYQWYSNSTATEVGATAITGATAVTYEPDTTATGVTYYYCVVTATVTGATSTSTDTSGFCEFTVTAS